jgi:hypothetical protein
MSLSLKQKLSNMSSGLQTQVDTLSTETAEAVAFFHNITSANADIAALEGTVSTNASGISGLQTTTAGQTSDIAAIESDVATNAQSIIDLNTGFQADLATKQPKLINTSAIDVFDITLHNSALTDTRSMNYAGVVSIEGNIGSLFGQVSTEISRASAAEGLNATGLSNEVIRAQSIEGSLRADLTAETTNRTDADTLLRDATSAEESRARAAELLIASNLTTESGSRISGDNSLQSNIDVIEGAINGEIARAGSAESAIAGNLVSEQNRALAAEQLVASNLSTETSNRETADSTLQSNIDAEVARAGAVESTNASNISAEASTRASSDFTIQNNVDAVNISLTTEVNRALAAESTLSSNLGTEQTRASNAEQLVASNLSTETSNRETAISGEASSRVAGDNKMCFCSMMEFEGLVVADTYPFASGYGSPSGVGFGLGVPFNYKVVGYSLNCVSTDTSPSIQFEFVHYDFGSTTAEPLDTCTMGASKYVNKSSFADVSHSGGNLVVKVGSLSGVSDADARYRVSVYLQSQDELA